jgi:hypothetical protein
MPLHELTDDERRSHCRREIEALECWLRRLVHETFSKAYGPGYLDATGKDGNQLFRTDTVKAIEVRRSEEPSRYARPIDAATLDDLVRVICKPENYNQHFFNALRIAFPERAQEARTFLNRHRRHPEQAFSRQPDQRARGGPGNLLHAGCDRIPEGALCDDEPAERVRRAHDH